MEDSVAQSIKILFNYGVLGVATIALGYLYHRSLAEIKTLNAVILELTRTTTSVIEKNTASLQNAAAAQERAAEAQRDLADALRSYPARAGSAR